MGSRRHVIERPETLLDLRHDELNNLSVFILDLSFVKMKKDFMQLVVFLFDNIHLTSYCHIF